MIGICEKASVRLEKPLALEALLDIKQTAPDDDLLAFSHVEVAVAPAHLDKHERVHVEPPGTTRPRVLEGDEALAAARELPHDCLDGACLFLHKVALAHKPKRLHLNGLEDELLLIGDKDDERRRVPALDLPAKLDTVHAAHLDVEEVDVVAVRIGLEGGEKPLGAGKAVERDLNPTHQELVPERLGEKVEDLRVVLADGSSYYVHVADSFRLPFSLRPHLRARHLMSNQAHLMLEPSTRAPRGRWIAIRKRHVPQRGVSIGRKREKGTIVKAVTRRRFVAAGGAAAAVAGLGLNGAGYYFRNVITRWWSGTFTKVSDENLEYSAEEAKANGEALSIDIMGEGAVLLKNNGVLPMSAGNIALLGYATIDPVYMGAGSVAQAEGVTKPTFYDAFEQAGFTIDETMRSYYEDYLAEEESRDNDAGGMFMMMGADYNIYDEPVDSYRDKLDAAAAANDTAVVVFSRAGGEGGDLPIDMADKTNGVAGKHYLQLQDTEQELLDYAKENFDNVIVLLDSANPMELGFLEDDKVSAAIWIGAPGASGLLALPKIMTGEYNPSGHLVDVFPYELKSNPTFYTSTCGTYNNYEEFDQTDQGYNNKVDGGMTWYPENIYMGYRYYETAAEMGTIDYDETVQFPFGFGLSYTTFDWSVESSSFGGVGEKIEFKVKVTNTGDVAGKDVVQLYYAAPWTEGGIEKSAKVLGAFAKTGLLEPGASETVTLTMDVDDLASYDYTGEGCYVADAGTYTFWVQTDSHRVKDGCEAVTHEISSKRVYNESGVGKRSSDFVVAENHFDDASAGDGNVGNTVPWMTRSDLAGTHPEKTMGEHIKNMDIAMGPECIEKILASEGGSDVRYEDDENYECKSLVPVETGAQNGLTVEDVAGYTEWNDPIWDQLVNQMSIDDMVTLLCDCGYGTPEIASIGKGTATDVDGPAGVSSQNLNYYGHEYCGEQVTAATWNVDLASKMGACVGDECLAAGINGWYAPGADTHRTPFGGRCAEYYSEDPVLTGKICAAEVRAVQEKGIYVYIKHFALNDQDQSRGGMYTWCNEQALREIYLRAFEIPIKEGGCKSVMEAYNRIGFTECSVNKALNTHVLKEEWGSNATCLTDGYSVMIGSDKYNNPDLQLRAGCGMLLYTGGYNGEGGFSDVTTGSEKGIEMLHDMCKRVIYVYANSSAMTVKRDYTPYWVAPLAAVDALLIGGIVASGVYLFKHRGETDEEYAERKAAKKAKKAEKKA